MPATWKLETFSIAEMMDLRSRLQALTDEEIGGSIEEAAQRVVRLFCSTFVDDRGLPACALVRIFKTHVLGELDPELQELARASLPEIELASDARCLVLVATAGDRPEWNDRRASAGHRVIPLASEEMVLRAPMVAQLLRDLGGEISTVLRPEAGMLLSRRERAFNVFYVPEALGSPLIPAQAEFVVPAGIASVVGFGGMVSTGDLYTAILFSKVPIPREVADRLHVVGLNFKLTMLRAASLPLFR